MRLGKQLLPKATIIPQAPFDLSWILGLSNNGGGSAKAERSKWAVHSLTIEAAACDLTEM